MATTYFIAKILGAPPVQGRFASIDGLRGFLAFFVFLHHASVWYFYLRSDKWELPPSNLYTHFGQSSVALFFMITGFLFFSKLIVGKDRGIDWWRLFVSRFLRLVPLYCFAMLLLFLVIAVISRGKLNEPILSVLKEMLRWLAFTIGGVPDLNGIARSWIVVADVTWSLPYEWMFYFSLPLLALTIDLRPPIIFLCGSVATFIYFEMWHPNIHYLSFLCGIAAAFLARSARFSKFAASTSASLIAIVCVIVTVAAFPSVYNARPLCCLAVSFALIASGNSLFGLLLSPLSRTLGELSYGIYLLHGIVLFVVFEFIIGVPASSALSSVQHWSVIVGTTPVLILICLLVFRFIERPAMQKTTEVSDLLRSLLVVRRPEG